MLQAFCHQKLDIGTTARYPALKFISLQGLLRFTFHYAKKDRMVSCGPSWFPIVYDSGDLGRDTFNGNHVVYVPGIPYDCAAHRLELLNDAAEYRGTQRSAEAVKCPWAFWASWSWRWRSSCQIAEAKRSREEPEEWQKTYNRPWKNLKGNIWDKVREDLLT